MGSSQGPSLFYSFSSSHPQRLYPLPGLSAFLETNDNIQQRVALKKWDCRSEDFESQIRKRLSSMYSG